MRTHVLAAFDFRANSEMTTPHSRKRVTHQRPATGKSLSWVPWLTAAIFLATAARGPAQVLLSEDFNNAQTAAARFTTSGSVQFSGQSLQLGPNSAVFLNAANPIADPGTGPVCYAVTESLTSGNIDYPNGHETLFYFRAPGSGSMQGYRIVIALYSTGAYLGINRVDANGSTTLVGGSLFAPPALYTLGPYELSVTFTDTASAVDIDVAINGVTALSAQDTSPNRFVSATSLGLGYYGTLGATFDTLQVTMVPEPSAGALLVFGGGLCGLLYSIRTGFHRRERKARREKALCVLCALCGYPHSALRTGMVRRFHR